jgi:hypothetical protein
MKFRILGAFLLVLMLSLGSAFSAGATHWKCMYAHKCRCHSTGKAKAPSVIIYKGSHGGTYSRKHYCYPRNYIGKNHYHYKYAHARGWR